jgi:hypothetical protein
MRNYQMGNSLNLCNNRLLGKLASGSQVLGAHGTEDRSVLDIHEDPSTGATPQVAAEVEFPEKSINKGCRKIWQSYRLA